MKKLLAGIGSLVALAVLLVGIPTVLIVVAGNPIPSVEMLQAAVSRPDYGGAFLLGTLLPIVAWIAWGTFAVSIITVVPSVLRGIQPPRIPGIRLQQVAAVTLLGSIIVMFTGFTGISAASAATIEASSYAANQSAAATNPTPDAVSDAITNSEDLPQYEVEAGDTLWTIAQAQLGDGKRYKEIAKLNYDVTQEDGGVLTPGNHWVAPGWILELPADADTDASEAPVPENTPAAPAPPTATPNSAAPDTTAAPTPEAQRTIQTGDTLWDIAEDEYGAGERYPEIFDASNDAVQADGQQLSDPDMILPGWQVTVPGATAAVAPAATSVAPITSIPDTPTAGDASEHETPNAGDNAAASTADSDVAASAADNSVPDEAALDTEGSDPDGAAARSTQSDERSAAVRAPSSAEELDDDAALAGIFASPTMTVGGIGSLLAAGILGLLGIRRYQQRRHRKPGQRISMPDIETATTELELRAVEDAQGVDDIDKALRFLASWARDTGERLPKLFAIRLSVETVELYLDEAADLPAPFALASDDHMAWTVNAATIPDFTPWPTAPYPGLVTLGQDAANGHILVDLERIGSLNIDGPDDQTTEGALTALAIELACSTWADDLHVTVVGFASELAAAFDTGRVQYVDDIRSLMSSLRGRARAYTQAFDHLGVDGPQSARTTTEAESWTPEIVLLRELPDEETQAELAELIEHTPRIGIAAITRGQLTGDWSLTIAEDRSAVLNPAGISIRAQIVGGAEYRHILDSLAVASRDATEVVPEKAFSTDLSQTEDEDTRPRRYALALDAPTTALDVPARSQPGTVPGANGATRSEPIVDEGPMDMPEPTAPVIRVLGQVRIDGAIGPEPRTAKTTYVAPATELLVFLALNPGATGERVSEALWPGKAATATSNRNELMSRTRRWLGKNSTDEDYVPYVATSIYQLHAEVTTDWDVWKQLVGDQLEKTPTRNLVAAMKLVGGQPFDGAPRRRYAWADSFRQEMIASIVDAAHELAERSLSIRDVATARLASIVGETADPASEIPVRDRLRAEALANDMDGVERVIARLEMHLAELEEEEPEEETQELIDELRRSRIASRVP